MRPGQVSTTGLGRRALRMSEAMEEVIGGVWFPTAAFGGWEPCTG